MEDHMIKQLLTILKNSDSIPDPIPSVFQKKEIISIDQVFFALAQRIQANPYDGIVKDSESDCRHV